jgi:uncharacterized protein (UPF0332 family)
MAIACAAFHALTAMFALRGKSFTKHTAIQTTLHRDLILPGILKEEVGRGYDFLLDLREIGDYGSIARV